MFKNAILVATALFAATAFAVPDSTAQLSGTTQILDALDVTPIDTNFRGLIKRECPLGLGNCLEHMHVCCPVNGSCCGPKGCCLHGQYCISNHAGTKYACCPNGHSCRVP
ncbi:hypothetical protein BJ138DRAFT_1154041 [Hygrophoropsis aurantiaca]|uniref:Uncharacterized protein n=1 Tax=Hygrophoropsis aurantiaca TaxID=72124 RepID=A0ACB8AB79_9AGAM|nr:hypothetical protein BJ138DRAFT_1154041 [Hygrophoropsis aurantiaca]